MTLEEFVEKLVERLEKESITIFTGAGLSTASGIKDFRGKNGLYKESNDVETKLGKPYFISYPASFYTFFVDNLVCTGIKPNIAHKMIADLENEGYLNGVITQNIDGLDRDAGTKNVIEIHGNAQKFYCSKCHRDFPMEKYIDPDVIPPVCGYKYSDGSTCNGIIRPDIVLYGEAPDFDKLNMAEECILKSKTVLVMGSSLLVAPACNLIQYFVNSCHYDQSKKLFIVNMGETPFDYRDGVYKYDGDIIKFTEEFNKARIKRLTK